MSDDWYCTIGQEEYGPISAAELKSMAKQGKLKTTDKVKKSEAGKWVAASKVQGLKFQPLLPSAEPESRVSTDDNDKRCPCCECIVGSADIFCGQCGADLRTGKRAEPAAFHAMSSSVRPNARSSTFMQSQATGSAKALKTSFRGWVACTVLMAVCGVSALTGIVLRHQALDSPEIRKLRDDWFVNDQPGAFERYTKALENPAARFWGLFGLGALVFGAIPLLGGAIFFCVLLYKLWEQVQDGNACTSPGKALGFLFIPIFNFYWLFVATVGLTKELNRCAQERNLKIKPASSSLMITYCILLLVAAIPVLGVVAVLINLGVGIAAFHSATKVAVALAQEA